MKADHKKIAIIGAGPAGLYLAYRLFQRSDLKLDITIIEEKPETGGLCSGFEYEGLYFDYGSHRLHPTASNAIFNDLRSLLGSDLLKRPRNGRMRLLDHFVKFPLNLTDSLINLPFTFFSGIIRDTLKKYINIKRSYPDTFEDILLKGLGKTICKYFYFPYAEKLWGLPPSELSSIQAQKRISANNISKIIKKVFSFLPWLKQTSINHFYYPRKGFKQMFDALTDQIKKNGVHIELSNKVKTIDIQKKEITTEKGLTINYDFVFSTMPLPAFVKSIRPYPEKSIIEACKGIDYRGMLFLYLILDKGQFTPFDAHYFPEKDIIFSRISEQKNYSASIKPEGMTGLCVEIPCAVGGALWNASLEDIQKRVSSDLDRVGLPAGQLIVRSILKRTSFAYPVYDLYFEEKINKLEEFINSIPNLVLLGRQSLFVHDNTHHTLEMAYRAAECLGSGVKWNKSKWAGFREEFKKHVVLD